MCVCVHACAYVYEIVCVCARARVCVCVIECVCVCVCVLCVYCAACVCTCVLSLCIYVFSSVSYTASSPANTPRGGYVAHGNLQNMNTIESFKSASKPSLLAAAGRRVRASTLCMNEGIANAPVYWSI